MVYSRLIQEETVTTEQRAMEIESCVGSGSLSELAQRWPDRSFERASPPVSGRSTPTAHATPQRPNFPTPSPESKYNTVSGGLAKGERGEEG